MHPHHHQQDAKIDDFFANKENPLYAGFSTKGSVHAAAGGRPVMGDALNTVWADVVAQPENSDRRALYIHIPFCVSRCKFCNFYQAHSNDERMIAYTETLLQELRLMVHDGIPQRGPIHAVYFGGGTPTDLPAQSLKKILSHLRRFWPLANDCEITIEGRIYGFDDEKVAVCLDAGVNRFSFGIQTFDTEIRRNMGRILEQEKLISRLDELAATGQVVISTDLIYGLPGQTMDTWRYDLELVRSLKSIDSCSLYQLKLLEGSPVQKLAAQGKMEVPDGRMQADFFIAARDYFMARGVKRLQLRHWAFSNRERSLYNLIPKYEQSCIPAGCGAGGRVGGYQLMQAREIEKYTAAVEAGEKPLAMAIKSMPGYAFCGAVVGGLEEKGLLNFTDLSQRFGIQNLAEKFHPLLSQWEEAGMISRTGDGDCMQLTAAGEFWNVAVQQNLLDYAKYIKLEMN